MPSCLGFTFPKGIFIYLIYSLAPVGSQYYPGTLELSLNHSCGHWHQHPERALQNRGYVTASLKVLQNQAELCLKGKVDFDQILVNDLMRSFFAAADQA